MLFKYINKKFITEFFYATLFVLSLLGIFIYGSTQKQNQIKDDLSNKQVLCDGVMIDKLMIYKAFDPNGGIIFYEAADGSKYNCRSSFELIKGDKK